METKHFSLKQIGDSGEGSAVIATLNQVDKDRDITLPGAFGTQPVVVVPTHNWSSVPLGKGTVSEAGNEAIVDFKLNMNSPTAKEWHSALKFDMENGQPLQEWSYGYDILEAEAGVEDEKPVQYLKKLKVFEVSPVLIGAGVNTRTLDVKEDKQFEIQTLIFPKKFWELAEAKKWCRDHDYKTGVDETNDSYRFRQEDPDDFTRLRTICLDPGRSTPMDDCKIKAVGGPRKAVEPGNMKMEQEFDRVEAALVSTSNFNERVKALAALRIQEGKEGRILSRANRTRLNRLLELITDVQADIDKLLADTNKPEDDDKAAALYVDYLKTRASIFKHL